MSRDSAKWRLMSTGSPAPVYGLDFWCSPTPLFVAITCENRNKNPPKLGFLFYNNREKRKALLSSISFFSLNGKTYLTPSLLFIYMYFVRFFFSLLLGFLYSKRQWNSLRLFWFVFLRFEGPFECDLWFNHIPSQTMVIWSRESGIFSIIPNAKRIGYRFWFAETVGCSACVSCYIQTTSLYLLCYFIAKVNTKFH